MFKGDVSGSQMRVSFLFLMAVSLAGFGCGEAKKAAVDSTETEQTTNKSSDSIQLKGVSLLGQSLYATLGPEKDSIESGSGNQASKTTSLFEVYASNFGSTEGLRFGEIFADSPSANYFLGLTIVADNAARKCQVEVLTKKAGSLCDCGSSVEKAREMLSRAVPHIDFHNPTRAELVDEFHKQCQSDYTGAVASLISSLGFAVRK
jgi:hypothetical protein